MTVAICFTYFRSLALANLQAALFSVRQQDFKHVTQIVIVDNNTEDPVEEIQAAVDALAFPILPELYSFKHGDASKTHPWSSNEAVRRVKAEWILFCRADYILDFGLLAQFVEEAEKHGPDWNGFVTGNVYHLGVDIGAVEGIPWRAAGSSVLRGCPGSEEDHTLIDAGVWFARRDAYVRVQGLNETLTSWGHAQTHFQYKLHATGTQFARIPKPLFFHPQHSAPRDLALAHEQLALTGVDLKLMWERYAGRSPY